MSLKLTIISGTNRRASKTKLVSTYVEAEIRQYLPEGSEITVLDLADLPLEIFKPESYEEKPKAFDRFRDAVLEANGIISVIPEYNGSAPGVFKYFLDMLPFPESLKDTPSAFVGVSAGKFGNLRGVEDMMGVFQYRLSPVFPYRIFLNGAGDSLDERGAPKDEFVLNLFKEQLHGFVQYVHKVKSAHA